jgi:hypothetical protein
MIQQPAGEGDVAPRCSNGADVTLESPEEFTNSLVTVLLHSVPAINVSIVSPLKLAFEYRGATGQHDLSNVYRLYCERPEKRDELLEDFSSMARDLNGQHIDRRRILPVVRNSQFYGDAFHEPYNSELHILYVEFRSPAMRILMPADITRLGIQQQQLRSLALNNLRRISPEILVRQTGNLHQARLEVEGNLVACIPNRDMLLMTGSGHLEVIDRMRSLAREGFDTRAYAVSDKLFIYHQGRFELFGSGHGRAVLTSEWD